ncbi:hypothetical protein PTTG_12303 [Puccinia triticina 1-1 BBBD Race 1]|uniref:Uncharacterized protein n=1 Tax=Puccinia triticina (isolate 1-1 / race 1 (BBBD)) TaxID=630390 RepID=A0A180H111_PUCT1|nr:hypothetical protein PTTG_12303 [Puccinia triticina 1-1 BBBD Race 1]
MQDTPKETLTEFNEEHQVLGDSVIDAFRYLESIWHAEEGSEDVEVPIHPSYQEDFCFEKANSREDVVARLHLCTLPLLARQLSRLQQLLDPAGLRTEPESRLTHISWIQSQVGHTVTQIQTATALVCPKPLAWGRRRDDRHLKELKGFRLLLITDRIQDAMWSTAHFFDSAGKLLKQIGLTTDETTPGGHPCRCHARWNQKALQAIRLAIYCLESESECDLVKHHWRFDVKWELLSTKKAILMLPPNPLSANYEEEAQSRLVREPAIQLTQSVLPISMLSRHFYVAVGNMMAQLPTYTEMNSHQLSSLCISAEHTGENLNEILELIADADNTLCRGETIPICARIREAAGEILERFEELLLILVLHLLPLVPGTDTVYNQDFFFKWHSMMTVVIDSFQRSNDRLEDSSLQ